MDSPSISNGELMAMQNKSSTNRAIERLEARIEVLERLVRDIRMGITRRTK